MRSLSTKRNLLTKENAKKAFFRALPFFMFAFFVFVNSVCPAFADDSYTGTVKSLAKSILEVVTFIFRVVGVVMAAYAVGTLVQAFQSNNPDAQSRGATTAVVALILIALPTIVKSLGLVEKIATVKF